MIGRICEMGCFQAGSEGVMDDKGGESTEDDAMTGIWTKRD